MYLVIYVQEHTCHQAAQAEPEEATAAGSSTADRLDFSAGLSRQQRDGVSGIVLDRGAKEEFDQQAIACLLQGRRCYSGPGTPEESLSSDCTGDSAWASAVSLHDHVMDYDVRDTEHAEAIDAFILREVSKDLTVGLLQGRRCYSGASTPEESSSPIFTGDDDASASTVSDTASWHAVATDALIPRQESQDFTVCGPAPATIATRRASHDGVPRNAPYFREARSSAVEDAEENSMFETSHVLGALLASSPLLARAWDRCVATGAASTGFVHDDGGRDGGMVCVAFSGLQAALSVAGPAVASGADVFAPVGLGGDAAGARAFPQLAAAEPDAAAAGERVAVQALALRCFLKLCGSPEFQMLLNQFRGKAVVFTGHSLGGAIAALAALHYLCISSLSSPCSPSPPVLCVTFGSPLVGNEALSRAILREQWGGNFCNVVSQHDVIPRLLFCPLDAVPMCVIVGMQLQQWPGHTHNTVVVDAEKEELRQLIQGHVCTVAMEQKLVVADPESRGGSPYRPFGAYVLWSPEGAVCVHNSTAAVRMLYATFAARGEGDTTSLDLEAAHSCYGHLVLKMPQNLLLKRRPHAMDVLASMSNSNYDTGISLAMEASGIGSEAVEATTTRYWLKASKREGRSPSLNCAGLATRLGRITPCRAQLEWYKASFDGNTGYYNAFKQRRSPKKFNKADMCRIKLGQFWDGVLTMLDYSQLPHNFHRRAKWVNAARFYQLLVEPLDIADYHRKNLHKIRGSYITHGRARRYELFDKWWKEKAAFTGTSTGDASVTATARSKYAGLTQDPCFWARVEEAWDRTESAQAEHDVAMLAMKLGRLREFERYARELVESKEVSIDVVAPQSSYTRWVEEWKKLLLRDEPRTASQF